MHRRRGVLVTAHEWDLILQALSAYQHNRDFRKLYDKLEGGKVQQAA